MTVFCFYIAASQLSVWCDACQLQQIIVYYSCVAIDSLQHYRFAGKQLIEHCIIRVCMAGPFVLIPPSPPDPLFIRMLLRKCLYARNDVVPVFAIIQGYFK